MTALQVPSTIPALELADFATPLASKADGEEAWHEARDEGVTASRIHTLHRSRAAWGRTVHEMLNGRTFFGNAATRRGHRLEPFLIADAADIRGTAIVENDRVWAAKTNPLHRATPDGFEHDGVALRIVEVKTHNRAHRVPKTSIIPGVPDEHYSQVTWAMHVMGVRQCVLIIGTVDDDGELPIDADPTIIVIDLDDDYLALLIATADAFIAWREAGCPVDDVSPEIRAAEEDVMVKHAKNAEAAAQLKAAWARLERLVVAEHPAAMSTGWSHDAGPATVTFAKPATRVVLDRDALAAGDPERAAELTALEGALADATSVVTDAYPKTTTAAPAKRVTPAKKKAA